MESSPVSNILDTRRREFRFPGCREPQDDAFARGDSWIFTHLCSLDFFLFIRQGKTHPHSPHGMAIARVPVGSHTESFPQCSHKCRPYKGEGYVHTRQCLKGKKREIH